VMACGKTIGDSDIGDMPAVEFSLAFQFPANVVSINHEADTRESFARDVPLSGCHVESKRIRRIKHHRADAQRELVVHDGLPVSALVFGSPDAARSRSDVNDLGVGLIDYDHCTAAGN